MFTYFRLDWLWYKVYERDNSNCTKWMILQFETRIDNGSAQSWLTFYGHT